MTTVAPAALADIFKQVDPYFRSVKAGGVANSNSPGYHTGRDDLIAQKRGDNYSIQCPADKDGDGRWASGIDLTFGDLDEMVTCHKRLRKACTPDSAGRYDPRIEPVREIIGTLDGKAVSGYNRVSTGSGSRSRVGWVASGYSDSSHLWHEHISILRRYAGDRNRMTGIAEVIAGLEPGKLGWVNPGGGSEVVIQKPVTVAPTYLEAYVVDPRKVGTFLWGVDHESGEAVKERAPGYVIDTGKEIIEVDRREWLLTWAGYRYALDFLALKSEVDARVEVPPVVVSLAAVRQALEGVPALTVGEPVKGTITALLATLEAEATERGFKIVP